jgi:hypothetical protein
MAKAAFNKKKKKKKKLYIFVYYNDYRVFPGGKVAGAWCWPPTSSSALVKE